MRNKKICKIFLALLLMAPVGVSAEIISVGAQLGWSVPQGKAFEYEGEKSAKGGVNVDVDVLYHFKLIGGGKFAAGVTYNGSFLFGADIDNVKGGIYTLSLFGAKGYYKFLPGPISTYAALSAGVTRFSIPKIAGLVDAESATSFGFRPEIGVKLMMFTVSAGYIIPTNYSFGGGKVSAGALQISLGMRLGFPPF